jgi:hypothetical protein
VQSWHSCGFLQLRQKIPNEFIHHRLNLVIGYVLKTAAFGKVLPDQTIGTTFKPRSQE